MKAIVFFLFIACVLTACKKGDHSSSQTNPPPVDQFFAKGADVSWLTQMESERVKFYNGNGTQAECMRLLKNLGMKIMIDFHYSDWWADPGKQNKPAGWASQDFNTLKTSVYNYTVDVMNALKTNGVIPDWVQIGNETNDGMLWPDGKASVNMSNFVQLINAGYDAVKSVSNSS